MSSSPNRMLRIADQIQRELAELLRTKVSDPRFYEVTITHVNVSPDMANAIVYISVLKQDGLAETLVALNKAAGFFRHHLAEEINLRITPRLKFVYDDSLERGSRISNLIDASLKKSED